METIRFYFIFLDFKITADCEVGADMKLKQTNKQSLAPWKKSYSKARQCIKKQRLHFADNSLYSQSCSFCISHVWV